MNLLIDIKLAFPVAVTQGINCIAKGKIQLCFNGQELFAVLSIFKDIPSCKIAQSKTERPIPPEKQKTHKGELDNVQ